MRWRHWLSLPLAIPKLFLAILKPRVNATLQTTSKPLLPMILVKPFFLPARSGESNWRSTQSFVRNLTNKFSHKGIIKNIAGDITKMNKTLLIYGPEIYTQEWNVILNGKFDWKFRPSTHCFFCLFKVFMFLDLRTISFTGINCSKSREGEKKKKKKEKREKK